MAEDQDRMDVDGMFINLKRADTSILSILTILII